LHGTADDELEELEDEELLEDEGEEQEGVLSEKQVRT
jgi:hypothetical protein